ncbi:MAG: AI-2E family transporter [Coriobacteriia bacterium]|nr:AI-2E family transporter [Coriobacteriia bacterium]
MTDDLHNAEDKAEGTDGQTRKKARESAQDFIEQFGVPRWLVSGGLTSLMMLFLGIGIAGFLYLFNLSSAISIPLLLAIVVAVVAYPLVKLGDKIRLPRVVSAVLVIVFIIGLGYATVHITFTGVISQAPAIGRQLTSGTLGLANYTRDALVTVGVPEQTIDEYMGQVTDGISNFFTTTEAEISGTVDGSNAESVLTSITATNTAAAATGGGLGDLSSTILQGANTVGRFLTGLAGGLFSTFIFLVFLFYFLSDFERIRDWIGKRLFKDERLGTSVINDVTYSLSGYFRATTLTGLIVAVAIGIPLWIMGVPLIVPIIIITVLTTYIPFLGALVASTFTVLIALATGGIYYALIAIVVMLIANNVLQTFVSNKLMGDYLNLHPLAVLIATLFGAVVLGLMGAALGAPFLAIGIAVYKRIQMSKNGGIEDFDLEYKDSRGSSEFFALFAPLRRLAPKLKARQEDTQDG